MRYGCNVEMTIHVPKGWDYRAITVRCGSTSPTGGVNQCTECAARQPMPEPIGDESDAEYDARMAQRYDY